MRSEVDCALYFNSILSSYYNHGHARQFGSRKSTLDVQRTELYHNTMMTRTICALTNTTPNNLNDTNAFIGIRSYLVHDHHAQDIPQQQVERLFGRRAKVMPVHCAHDVRVPIDEPQEFVQQPKETPHARENRPGERIVIFFQFHLHPLEYCAYEVADGDDQRPESHRSQVVSA